jgi:hypothetical protein
MGEKEMENTVTHLKIGVVGFSGQKFDTKEARLLLIDVFDQVIREFDDLTDVTVVSGLTDLGIPALAYREAVTRGWGTEGIACAKAEEYECFLVDSRTIIGNEWGDESATFLASIDVIVRIGGGKQSLAEVQTFKSRDDGKAYERELAALPN